MEGLNSDRRLLRVADKNSSKRTDNADMDAIARHFYRVGINN